LAGCGGGDSTPPAPAPYAGWSITQWGTGGVQAINAPRPILTGGFDIPCCSASSNWISYVEHPAAGITGALSASWHISGSTAPFLNDSPGNSCGGPAAVSLLFRTPARFFSQIALAVPLAEGSASMSVPLTADQWVNVDGGVFNPAAAISIGFGLGAGCFSAHGVAVSSGVATFTIDGMGASQ
jgi:hypothetical protein